MKFCSVLLHLAFFRARLCLGHEDEFQALRIYEAIKLQLPFQCSPAIIAFLHIVLDTALWPRLPLLDENSFCFATRSVEDCMLNAYLGAPNASGIRSTVYRYPLMYIHGTPGILRILPRSSLSHVATM